MKIYEHITGNGSLMKHISGEHSTPLNHSSNRWVKLEDAEVFGRQWYERGHEAGLHHSAQSGYKSQAVPATPTEDNDRKRLLNELYHDRARLERQVQQAVQLIDKLIAYAEDYQWVDDNGERIHNDYPLFGSLEQFADSHRE